MCSMSELRLRPNRAITEDDLAVAQPAIRAVIHERLEDLWAQCEESFGADRPDPRFSELGLRVLKELASLYRLGAPQPVTDFSDEKPPRQKAIEGVRADMDRLVQL